MTKPAPPRRLDMTLQDRLTLQDGWVYGEERSLEKKTHPDLVSWDKLSDEEIQTLHDALRDAI